MTIRQTDAFLDAMFRLYGLMYDAMQREFDPGLKRYLRNGLLDMVVRDYYAEKD